MQNKTFTFKESDVVSDSVKMYFDDLATRPLLNAQEERELLIRIKNGDQKAYKYFLECNLRLVVSIAKKYIKGSMEFLDIIQEGNLGLIEAVERFDLNKNLKFSTYAIYWIRQAIVRGFEEKSRPIRLPANLCEKINRIFIAKRDLINILGREPDVCDLALYLNYSVKEVEELLRLNQTPISLNAVITCDSDPISEIENLLPSYDMNFDSLLSDNLSDVLGNMTLSEKEKMILILHFGFNGKKTHTLDEIGKILGVTRQRVSQLEQRIFDKIISSGILDERKKCSKSKVKDFSIYNSTYFADYISSLPALESMIMALRFGYKDGANHDLTEIAKLTGLSTSEVSTILIKTLKNFKKFSLTGETKEKKCGNL